jgi:hypothetical protein
MRLVALFLLAVFAGCARSADVASAFQQVRRGNYEAAAGLKVTETDVPVISGFLHDTNEAVVCEAVVLLGRIGGATGGAALVPALTLASADVRERAARALHQVGASQGMAGITNLESALHRSVEMGNSAAAALLLLGRFQDEANRQWLKLRLAATAPMVKLHPWNTPVPQGLAAAVAGVSAGLPEARPRLLEGLRDLAHAEFLALALPDVADPAALRSLLPLLDDTRPTRLGVPSSAQPQRRVCDLAVDGFLARLTLHPTFSPRPSGRYAEQEIAQVKALVSEAPANR